MGKSSFILSLQFIVYARSWFDPHSISNLIKHRDTKMGVFALRLASLLHSIPCFDMQMWFVQSLDFTGTAAREINNVVIVVIIISVSLLWLFCFCRPNGLVPSVFLNPRRILPSKTVITRLTTKKLRLGVVSRINLEGSIVANRWGTRLDSRAPSDPFINRPIVFNVKGERATNSMATNWPQDRVYFFTCLFVV